MKRAYASTHIYSTVFRHTTSILPIRETHKRMDDDPSDFNDADMQVNNRRWCPRRMYVYSSKRMLIVFCPFSYWTRHCAAASARAFSPQPCFYQTVLTLVCIVRMLFPPFLYIYLPPPSHTHSIKRTLALLVPALSLSLFSSLHPFPSIPLASLRESPDKHLHPLQA